jgi:predicted hotdog family 3-hydroxylacyl-ACP dehydratase
MLIDREAISAMIPHGGSMCLLDGVVEWDSSRIICVASSHRNPANPLARAGRLPAVCGVEFASQAMALHGALTRARPGVHPRPGYLASLRELRCAQPYLDDCGPQLTVEARLQLAHGTRMIYDFELRDAGRVVVAGQAAVALDTGQGTSG